MASAFCPQCGHERLGALGFCANCGFDFARIQTAPPSARNDPVEPAREPVAAASSSTNQLPLIAGVAWLIGAAAIAYLALLQLQYSSLGFADSTDAGSLALFNGVAAAITVYVGARAIMSPTRQRLLGGAIWGVANVGWGAYQVSQGVTHEAFIVALIAFGIAAIVSFVAWTTLSADRLR